MSLSRSPISIGLVLFAAAVSASAQSFIVSQNGQSVGTATLAVHQSGAAVSVSSEANIKMPGLDYNFAQNQTLDAGFHLKTAQLKGSVNGTKATVNAAPQGNQFALKIDANGHVTTTPLDFHPQAVFFPDFDPAALQTVLSLGATRNNRDLWALVPKQTGSVQPLRITTKANEHGTLNGKPVEVHHLTVTMGSDTTELFSGPQNELLQAEWTQEGFALVRKGFILTPPARPGAPPPPAQQQPATAAPVQPQQ